MNLKTPRPGAWCPVEAALRSLCRRHGIDPDGPLVPMTPAADRRRSLDDFVAEGERQVRDTALLRAIARLR